MNRIQRVKKILAKSFDAILVSSVPNIIYLTGFSGFSDKEREAYLLISKNKSYIFTDGRYSEAVRSFKEFELVEISAKNNFETALTEALTKEKIKRIAIDTEDLKVSEFKKIRKLVKTSPDENLVENLRSMKDNNEITEIKKACRLGDKVFRYILTELKLGITEISVSKKIEIFILKQNGEISFKPIVAFGKNSSSPHHVCGKTKLRKNQIVLLDFGIKVNSYCSDMTRTVIFGKASDKQKKIYQTVLAAQTNAIGLLRSSIINHKSANGSELDKIARTKVETEGFPTIPHSLGHGIGLEVHERPSLSPKSKDELKENMVFSVEPGIYIPGFGGVRIEDLVVLTKNGPQIITRANRKIIEL